MNTFSLLRAVLLWGWLWPVLGQLTAAPDTISPFIRIDQFGYLPLAQKVAVIVDPVEGFNAGTPFSPGSGEKQYQLRRWETDEVVFHGSLEPWKAGQLHAQSGDRGWYFDFSAVTESGSYYVFDRLRKVGSYRFEINEAVYDPVLKAALRMFFYQRINFPKEAAFAGEKWADGPAYAEQEFTVTNRWAKDDPRTARDLHGGWYDAGDPNKYTTFSLSALLALLEAYRQAPELFGDANGIPESGNGLPDLLDELRWELDWLMRMQDATGTQGFLLKMGVDNHNDVSPPSEDRRRRYYYPECTSATLSGAAMFALAGLVYRDFASERLPGYGQALLLRAEAAFDRAEETTQGFTVFETSCDDGDIKSGDADRDSLQQLADAVVAAAYLYQATGMARYQAFVEDHFASLPLMEAQGWSPYHHPAILALSQYARLFSVPRATQRNLRRAMQNNLLFSLDDFTQGRDLYRAHLSDDSHHWGSNSVRAAAGNLLLDVAFWGLAPAQAGGYVEAAAGYLHYLHGVNPLGMVYLTNMYAFGGDHCANEMYHTWFCDGSDWDNAQTSRFGPPPGYLTGGPNRFFTGLVADSLQHQPPGKAYKDWNSGWPENSWEITEPGIYYQAHYVLLLARLIAWNRRQDQPSR